MRLKTISINQKRRYLSASRENPDGKRFVSKLIRIDIESIKRFGPRYHGKRHCLTVHGLPDIYGKSQLFISRYSVWYVPKCAVGIGQQVTATETFNINIGTAPIFPGGITDRPCELEGTVRIQLFEDNCVTVLPIGRDRVVWIGIRLFRYRVKIES